MDSPAAQAILVLGMHRSGTSAVAGALRLLGATPPKHVLPAAPDNPSGFWEAMSILGANDWILSKGGAAWYDCLRFDANALDAQTRTTALTFIMLCMMTGSPDAPSAADQGPSALPADGPVAAGAACSRGVTGGVAGLRSPEAVAKSLAARDDRADSHLRRVVAAPYARCGIRHPRLPAPYSGLRRSSARLAGRVHTGRAARRGSPGRWICRRSRRRWVGSSMRGCAIPTRSGGRTSAGSIPFAVWLEEAYAALCDLARDADDQRTLQRLDHVRAAFGTWCRTHGHAWADAFASARCCGCRVVSRSRRVAPRSPGPFRTPRRRRSPRPVGTAGSGQRRPSRAMPAASRRSGPPSAAWRAGHHSRPNCAEWESLLRAIGSGAAALPRRLSHRCNQLRRRARCCARQARRAAPYRRSVASRRSARSCKARLRACGSPRTRSSRRDRRS